MLSKRVAVLICLVLFSALAAAGPASAANETVTLETTVKPLAGKLYREVSVPASMSLSVRVHTPVASPKVSPLKRAVMKFPTDLSYNPDNRKTPVCDDSALSEQSNLAGGIAATVDLCPRSVIGTGTAEIYLAKIHNPGTLVDDPEMVIFNAGRDQQGNAKMKIYAYSKTTNVGILMYGSLTPKGIQDVAIPVLAEDSATASFVLSIPGPGLTVSDPDAPGGTRTIRGLDPSYAKSRCSTGEWTTGGTFTLGERTYPAGIDTGPETIVEATPFKVDCVGLSGRARLGSARATGPKSMSRGSRNLFRVTVRNGGTATARSVRVKVSGGGRGQSASVNIPPGVTRKIPVKVRITGRKGSIARFVFRVSGRGTATRVVARARVAR